jgi:hypothetical protein
MTLEIIIDAIVAGISAGATDTAKLAIDDADQGLSPPGGSETEGDQRLIKPVAVLSIAAPTATRANT